MRTTGCVAVTLALSFPAIVEGADLDERLPQIIVKVVDTENPGASLEQFIVAFQDANKEFDFSLAVASADEGRRLYLLQIDSQSPELDLDALEMDLWLNSSYAAYLEWAEFDYEGETAEGRTGSFWFALGDGQTHFGDQYTGGLTGLPDAAAMSSGAGTVVAVLDTGVDAGHPALSQRVLETGYDFVDDTSDTGDTGDGIDTDGDGLTDEMVGHGTFVASLINLVAPEAGILPVRVLDGDGTATNWRVAQGLHYAIDQGVEVINASLGSTYASQAVADAVEEARQHGIVVMAAAGNSNLEAPGQYPALFDRVMGVAATDVNDLKAEFSNFHGAMGLCAPGASAIDDQTGRYVVERSIVGGLPGGGYAVWEGTSFSTAFVSGAAALVRAQHPEWNADVGTATTVEDILEATATLIDDLNPGHSGLLGAGRLDAGSAVALGPEMPRLGDLNNDGIVNSVDIVTMLGQWELTHSSADLDGDGVVGTADALILLTNWGDGLSEPGEFCGLYDINGDGVIDDLDLIQIIEQWGYCLDCSGDLDSNEVVDGRDVVTMLLNWGACD